MPTLEYLAVATISNKNVDMKCSENNIDYLIEIIYKIENISTEMIYELFVSFADYFRALFVKRNALFV